MKRTLAVVLSAALAACAAGGSSNSDGTVNGTITGPGGGAVGISVVEGDSITFTGPACGQSEQESVVAVVLSDRGGACNGLETSGVVSNSTSLILFIAGQPAASNGSAPAIGPNTYPIGNPVVDASGNTFAASGLVSIYDATCNKVSTQATSGSIVISSAIGGVASGTFNLTFATGTLSGTFDAPACSLTATEFCAIGSATSCNG